MEGTQMMRRGKAGLITLAFIAIAVGAALWVSSEHTDSVLKMRELTLREDLQVMRAILGQYTLDKHQRPQSLHDLVTAGYLKQMPTDPVTGRDDTWAVDWSNDPKTPGIDNIRSGSRSISSKGTAYGDW
jgi:general secretion pathway protein G